MLIKFNALKQKIMKLPLILLMVFLGCLINLLYEKSFPIVKYDRVPLSKVSTEVCFSPEKDCKNLIISEINKAQKSLYIMVSNLLSIKTRNAIIKAKERGVDVRFITNAHMVWGKDSQMQFLKNNYIAMKFIKPKLTSYNNFIVIDEEKVITGAFQLLRDDDKNQIENLLIINSKEVAAIYVYEYMQIY